jgi:hypothetical protein
MTGSHTVTQAIFGSRLGLDGVVNGRAGKDVWGRRALDVQQNRGPMLTFFAARMGSIKFLSMLNICLMYRFGSVVYSLELLFEP